MDRATGELVIYDREQIITNISYDNLTQIGAVLWLRAEILKKITKEQRLERLPHHDGSMCHRRDIADKAGVWGGRSGARIATPARHNDTLHFTSPAMLLYKCAVWFVGSSYAI
jgi:hypothetical protein